MTPKRPWTLNLRLPLETRARVYRAKGKTASVNDWLVQQVYLGLAAHTRFTDGREGD